MSPATARVERERTASAPRRATPSPRPELRVLPQPRFHAPRGPFVLVVGAVLTVGLIGVLLLNTVVAQDAFAVSALQARSAALADQEQALTQQVAAAESPQRLERRARALGMVPSVNPVFLRLADGKVLGEATPASAPAPVVPATTGTSATDGKTADEKAADEKSAGEKNGAKKADGQDGGVQVTPNAVKTKAATTHDTPRAVKTKAARARTER